MMRMTMVEKLLARTSGHDFVHVGEILECNVDQVLLVDISFTLSEMIQTKIETPEQVT